MNIGEFTMSINSSDAAMIIKEYFDEITVLYNLIGTRHDIDICTGDNINNIAEFILMMDSKKDAQKLYDYLNNTGFSVYDNTYYISMDLKNESIITKITQKEA